MTEILDHYGHPITLGARVLSDDERTEVGTVTELTDPDGDVNSYGRPVAYGPFVCVQYDDGTMERWTATWNATGPWDDWRDDYTCDDIAVKVELHHAFAIGDNVLATTTASDIPATLTDAKAVVTRIIGDDERDAEVGPMYEVTVTVQVFEDELTRMQSPEPDGQRMEAGRIVPTDR